MKKILFFISTLYVLGVFVVAIPAFSTNTTFFIKKYEADEKQRAVIVDVYESRTREVQIASWSILVIYGMFACAVFLDRKKRGTQS